MEFETYIVNLIFLIMALYIVYPATKRILKYISVSISDYAMLLIFIFNCLPVALDLFVGVPQYHEWYRAFQEPITDFKCCLIYNVYNLLILFALKQYGKKYRNKNNYKISQSTILRPWRNKWIDIGLCVLPLVCTLVFGNLSALSDYTTLDGRGMDSGISMAIVQLMNVALFFGTTRFFSRERSSIDYIFFAIYLFILCWLNGKRYIIANILLMSLFLYENKKHNTKKRLNLKFILPIVAVLIILFSYYYIIFIRVTTLSSDYAYSSLRIDFGRDDVTKFVIDSVLLKGEQILEYPGETFLSTIFMFVPRSFWPSKPYPHFRYLTAAIYNTTLDNIPAGMTPSIFEMSICNFGWVGIFVCCLIILMICKVADREKNTDIKLIYLFLLSGVLTQSMDSLMSIILILILYLILGKYKFTFGKK